MQARTPAAMVRYRCDQEREPALRKQPGCNSMSATSTLRPCSAVLQAGGAVEWQNTRMECIPVTSVAAGDSRHSGMLNSGSSFVRIGTGYEESIVLRRNLSSCSPCD